MRFEPGQPVLRRYFRGGRVSFLHVCRVLADDGHARRLGPAAGMTFAPGRVVLHRNVRCGRLGWVRPGRVVSDDERGLLLWVAARSPVAHEVAEDGREMRSMPFAEWVTLRYRLYVTTWQGPGVLKFT